MTITLQNVGEEFQPLVDLLGDRLLKACEVADHLRYSEQHLANLRRIGRSTWLPWIHLPGGAIRYRAADVVAAQIGAVTGPLNLDRVILAIAACRGVGPDAKLFMQQHLRATFVPVRET